MILVSIQSTQDYSRPPCFSVRHILFLHQSLIQSQPLWSSCPHPPGSNSSPSLPHLPLGSPDWLKISELPQGPQRPGENADGRMSTSPCLIEKLFPSLLSLRPSFIPIPPGKFGQLPDTLFPTHRSPPPTQLLPQTLTPPHLSLWFQISRPKYQSKMPSSRAPLSFLLPSKVTATLLNQTHSYTFVHTPDATFWMSLFFFLFFFFWSHGFRQWLSSKELGCNAGDTGDEGSISGLGRSPEGGYGKIPWRRIWQPTPVFLPGKSPVDRGVWRATVHEGSQKSQTWLSN